MANEFVARNGVIAQNNSIVTGSLVVTNGITGSLFGTSSLATSASYALTASFALNGGGVSFPYSGSAQITGSLGVTGSLSVSGISTFGGSTTAASAIARSTVVSSTLVASANSDVLSALYIAPTFTTASFTGVKNYALNVQGPSYFVGKVAINTTQPQGNLEVNSGNSTAGALYVYNTLGSYTANQLLATIDLGTNDNGNIRSAARLSAYNLTNADSGNAYLVFSVYNGSVTTERMRLLNTGFLGLNTTTIGSQLQVNGNVAIGYNASTAAPTNGLAVAGAATFASSVSASSFVKSGGTSAQILAGDGSVITAGTNITISGGTISSTGGGGVGFPFSGSAVITGSFLVSQSFVDFSKASYVTGSFTGSLFGTASYATFAVSTSFAPGFTVSMSQATPATTWSFTHNLNTRNPIIQVYDTTFAQIIPNQIVGISPLQAEIRFDYGQNGYAIASNGGGLYVTGSTALLNQTSPAVTWSFQHNLNNQYNTYQVYDTNNYVIIPSAIKVIDNNNTEIHLNYSSSGKAVASFSGINGSPNAASASYAITSSFAVTASYVLGGGGSGIGFPFTGSAQITGSLGLSGSLSITSGSLSGSDARFSGFVTIQSASVDYAENTSVTLGAYRVIASEATSSYRAAFFDYVMFSGSVVRAGTVTSTWSGSSTEYYENYTADLGGSTSGVQLQTALSTGNIQLQASSSTSAWTIRSLIRLL